MNDPLAIYLHDHLGGSHFAVKLLDSLHDQYGGEPLGTFAAALRADVKQDQGVLEEIISHVGKASLGLAEAAGWLVERAASSSFNATIQAAGWEPLKRSKP